MMQRKPGLKEALIILPLLVCGCQMVESMKLSVRRPPVQSQVMDEARRNIASGDHARARIGLEQVVAAAPLSDVTDEALFRLALFSLPDDNNTTAMFLDRLQRGFPNSIWNQQAAPLRLHISRVKNLKDRQRELATLKALNMSLHKDNRELRQTLDRLKELDLELEQRIKR